MPARWYSIVAAGLFTVLCGCDLHEYVPSAEKLRLPTNPSKAFIIDESEIWGVYGNTDVDAAIYQFTTKHPDESRFWTKVQESAEDQWKLVHEDGHIRHYERIVAATGEQRFHSVEQVRIAYGADTSTITVAWVQADVRRLPRKFPNDGAEGEFAKYVVWPRFAELVHE
jgi:hypothetical protein